MDNGKLYLKKQTIVGFKFDFVADGGSRNSNLSFMLTEVKYFQHTLKGQNISWYFEKLSVELKSTNFCSQ